LEIPRVSNESNSVIKTHEYAYTADELVQMWREAMVRWADYVLTIAWMAAIPGLGSVVIAMRGGFPWLGVLLCIIIVVAGAIYPGWRTRYIRRQHAARESSRKIVTQWHEFDGHFMTTHLSNGEENRIALGDFVIYVVTNRLLYLYIVRKEFMAIPLRAFDSTGEIQAIYQMLLANSVNLRTKHPKGGWT
jgi:hypothetical protein